MANAIAISKITKTVVPRKYFFAEVDNNTPFCVLEELLAGYDLPGDRDELIHEDYLDFFQQLSIEPRDCDGIELARYINPHLEPRRWTINQITSAYRTLISYAEDKIKIPENFEIGYQTPNKTDRVPLFVIYKKCLAAGVQLYYESDIFEIEKAYRLLSCPEETYLRQFSRLMALGLQNAFIPLLVQLPINLPEEDFVYTSDFDNYPTRKGIISEPLFENYTGRYASTDEDIIPDDHAGAVVLAALKFQVNISYARDPSVEFYLLNTQESYQPLDPWMNHWYQINPDLFNLSVTFDPWFPKKIYRLEQLGKKLLALEGRDPEPDVEIYDQLQLIHSQDNVYRGKYPGTVNTESAISTELISSYSNSDILTFKFHRGEIKNYAISKEDLLQYFEATSTLVTPFNSSLVFSEAALAKIKLLYNSNQLSEKIDHIKALVNSDCEEFRRFRSNYDHRPELQSAVVQAVYKLLDLSMFMRGWDGQSERPIESAITPPEFFDQLLINVTNCITELEEICNSLEDLDIRNLPLIFYNDKKYYKATNADDGLTIGQRLHIIRQGEDTKNEASCIRISSNCIGASAHRILEILSIEPPFRISNLRHIL